MPGCWALSAGLKCVQLLGSFQVVPSPSADHVYVVSATRRSSVSSCGKTRVRARRAGRPNADRSDLKRKNPLAFMRASSFPTERRDNRLGVSCRRVMLNRNVALEKLWVARCACIIAWSVRQWKPVVRTGASHHLRESVEEPRATGGRAARAVDSSTAPAN